MSKLNIDRPLHLALRLLSGSNVSSEQWASENKIDIRTVQRDIIKLREAIQSENFPVEIHKNSITKHISLSRKNTFDSPAALTLAKLVLASRAFNKDEMEQLIVSILGMMSTDEADQIRTTLRNEQIAYTPVTHHKDLINLIWTISSYIDAKQTIAFTYTNAQGGKKKLFGLPTGLLFDTYYFYVIIHFQATEHHAERDAYYRLDRFDSIEPESRHIA